MAITLKIALIAHHQVELEIVNSELRNSLPAEMLSNFGKIVLKVI